MKKVYTSWEYFVLKTLKTGDLFTYSPRTCAQEIILKAKKLGGLLEYVPPSDPDYKHGNGGLMVRVVTTVQ